MKIIIIGSGKFIYLFIYLFNYFDFVLLLLQSSSFTKRPKKRKNQAYVTQKLGLHLQDNNLIVKKC